MASADTSPTPETQSTPLTSVGVRRSRLLGFLIGLGLLCAAGAALLLHRDALSSAIDALRSASPGMFALALAGPLVSVALASVTFWVLTTRYGAVGRGEMFALIGSAWLMNYLPLWPGMIGRLAYHKSVNGIAVRDSAKAIIWANLLNLIAAMCLLGMVVVGLAIFGAEHIGLAALAMAPAPLLLAAGAYARIKRPEPDPEVWRILVALGVRVVELHVHALRTFVCFSLVGAPIGWGGALAIASVSGLAGAINIAPNGLGVREWVVGLVAPALPVSLTLRGDLRLTQGLSADLVNRAAEVVVAIPVGLTCAAWLARRARASQA